jgi:EAL domain-containing protein (putative c-di-GMP-specific phosphodiesterase class I)
MYSVKDDGKNAERLFEAWMGDLVHERFRLQSELAGALARGELFLQYQPSFTLTTGGIEGFEALIRWQHPTMGLIPPDGFIPIAEESGLIVPIGRWVLQEAARQLKEWSDLGPQWSRLTMAVNVSSRQIREASLIDDVRDAIAHAGIPPDRLVLELTESVLVHNPAEVTETLLRLKAEGVRIAIDDFGTGYSSLSYLRDLPIDILKVDKSFVSCMECDEQQSSKLVEGILNIARALGLQTIAEGIEDSAQAARLVASGCDIGQGFLWARPLGAADAGELLCSIARERASELTT